MIYHFNFPLPDDITKEHGTGTQDGKPGVGFCTKCRRMRVRTYMLGGGGRACSICIEDTVRAGRVRIAQPRPVADPEQERKPQPEREELRVPWTFDFAYWNRQFA